MSEKLTIDHLAPYLPYKLKIKYGDKVVKMNTGTGSSVFWIGISAVIQRQHLHYKTLPILRPMADLTREIEHKGEMFVPIDNLDLHHNFSMLRTDTIKTDGARTRLTTL